MQASFQVLTTAIFFASCFMSFMTFCYVPVFLEDRFLSTKEHYNRLYGAMELVFSISSASGSCCSRPSFPCHPLLAFQLPAHCTDVSILGPVTYLDILTAESVVVFVASLVPNYAAALSIIAFANALWMCISDFMTRTSTINGFREYVCYYWDYLN